MYNVIVLAEQALSPRDAEEVTSLHDAIEDERHYHVIIPCENAAAQVEMAIGTMATTEVLGPPVISNDADVEAAQSELDHQATSAVSTSISAIVATGHQADGAFTRAEPVQALEQAVTERAADEVIVMTRPHVVAEFFHVDWTSKARRRLGVPVLHLVEHEPLDAEAGGGEGVTGM